MSSSMRRDGSLSRWSIAAAGVPLLVACSAPSAGRSSRSAGAPAVAGTTPAPRPARCGHGARAFWLPSDRRHTPEWRFVKISTDSFSAVVTFGHRRVPSQRLAEMPVSRDLPTIRSTAVMQPTTSYMSTRPDRALGLVPNGRPANASGRAWAGSAVVAQADEVEGPEGVVVDDRADHPGLPAG